MLYFDTSFLTPLLREEATSSQGTRVEFSSLLALHVRGGDLSADAARKMDAGFDAMVEETFVVLLPDVDDFDLARQYLAHHKTGLRAGDALHLAIAANHRVEAIFTLDKTFIKAGEMLGLPVRRGV